MIGLDVHKDTPTEILHTVLLGIVKYFWAQTYFILDKAKQADLFRARLNSIDPNGLNGAKIQGDYMCQYRGGLIGKHFKVIAQIMSFAVLGLVADEIMKGWLLIGELVVLLWHTSIDDLEPYLVSIVYHVSYLVTITHCLAGMKVNLDRCILDLLSVIAICAPSIIATKSKLHFLSHIVSYIRRFGPAILFSAERFESFHKVWRTTAILSNRCSPSYDSARRFMHLERLKHIATGGFWKDIKTQQWVHGSKLLFQHLILNPEHANLLGLTVSGQKAIGAHIILFLMIYLYSQLTAE